MSLINHIPSIKTETGFDTLNTISTFINHTATNVLTNNDVYEITVPTPDNMLAGQFLLTFIPDSNNVEGMKIKINGGEILPIYGGDNLIPYGSFKTGIAAELLVDAVAKRAYSVYGAIQSLKDAVDVDISSVYTAIGLKAPINSPTFTGTVTAPTNTSYGTRQVRNIIISTSDPSGGSNGDIWLKYLA